jgi:hypothetical protein
VAADLAYQFPIWLETSTPVARISIMVGTAVPATLARLALYTARPHGPGAANLLVGSMTEYDMNAAANTVHELVLPGPPRLPRGLYWGCARFNGAAQPRTAAHSIASGASSFAFQQLLGATNALAVQSAGNFVNCRVTAPLGYEDAWPAVMPAPTISTSTPGSPLFQWRRN